MAIDTTRQLIAQIRNASQVGENTAMRVGDAMEAILDDAIEQGGTPELKTINGQSLHGEGNIQIGSQGTINIDATVIPDSPNAVSGGGVKTYVDGVVGVVLVSGTPLAQQMTTANTTYIVKSAINMLGTSVAVPANSIIRFDGGRISSGTLVLQNTLLDGKVQFGSDMTISGTCANQTAHQSWFVNNNVDAWHRFINNVDCSAYEYTEGIYNATERIVKELNKGSGIKIEGNNAELLFPYAQNESSVIIRPKNQDTYVSAELTSVAGYGEESLTVDDASVFNVGDFVAIMDTTDYSFSWHRDSYRQGEFAQILGIAGNVLTINHPLYGSYQHLGASFVYGYNYISADVRNLKLGLQDATILDGNYYALTIRQAIGGVLENVSVNGGTINMALVSCQNVSVYNCYCCVNETQPGVDSYALSISNCQNVNVIGGVYTGGNHGITIGGAKNNTAVVSRNISINNASAHQIRTGFTGGIDMHGCAEFVTIQGCSTSGIYLRGQNNRLIGNNIRGNSVALGEMISLNHTIEDNIFYDCGVSGILSGGTNANWVKETTKEVFCVRGNRFFNTAPTTSSYFGLNVNVPTTYVNVENVVLDVVGNTFKNCYVRPSFASNANGVANIIGNIVEFDSDMTTARPGSSPVVVAKDFTIKNNTINIANAVNLFTLGSKNTYIIGNKINTVSALMYRYDANAVNVTVKDNILSGSVISYTNSTTSENLRKIVIKGNIIQGTPKTDKCLSFSCHASAPALPDVIVTDNIISSANNLSFTYLHNITIGRNMKDNHSVFPTYTSAKCVALLGDFAGTTTERNAITMAEKGAVWYDTTLKRNLIAALKDGTNTFSKQTNSSKGMTFETNNMTEGVLYHFTCSRDTFSYTAFSKVNSNPTEDDLIVVLNGTSDAYAVAPDPTVYPYVAIEVGNASWTWIYGSIVTVWQDVDGASAGVLRAGTTANRPVSGDIYTGFQYFDVDLGHPIWWNGSAWIKGDGTTA